MIRSILLIAAILAIADGAVLVRFINTVPTRVTTASVTQQTSTTSFRLLNSGYTTTIDRVGLQYFAQTGSSTASPTIVWTQLLQDSEISSGSYVSPYAWFFAMPPLRAYHTLYTASASETVAIDKPLSPINIADNQNIGVDQYDFLEQTHLFADGVGLYLSFAAGTYQMQAYAAITPTPSASSSNIAAVTATAFPTSTTTFTFADMTVYTIVAYGTGNFGGNTATGNTTPLSGSNVQLALLTESVAPAPFGSASLRFFHGIQTQATNTINVYTGTSFTSTNAIASNIAYGSVSAYVTVAPGLQATFPIGTGSGSSITPISSDIHVQRDVRAGTVATVICAITDSASAVPFCRAIPSRAVAYVRLVHDAAGQDSLVSGLFGAQKLSATNLQLWASYELPRPEQVSEQSQVMGSSVQTGHPALQDGLYPVVVGVAPGSVSGYGEVFVPLFIMDFAVRFVITADYTERLGSAVTSSGTSSQLGYQAGSNTDFTGQSWFYFAPVFKRCNLVVKTEGFATIASGAVTSTSPPSYPVPYPFVGSFQIGKQVTPSSGSTSTAGLFTGVATGTQSLVGTITLDRYFEPGQYYTLFVTANNAPTATTPLTLQTSLTINTLIRLDRSVAKVSQGVATGTGSFNLVPFWTDPTVTPTAPSQSFSTVSGQTFSLQVAGSNSVPNTPSLSTIGVNAAVAVAPLTINAATGSPLTQNAYVSTDTTEVSLTPGTYGYIFSVGTGNACYQNIPSPGSVTITQGVITDLFVLNVFGCTNHNSDTSRLSVVIQPRQSAVAAGNSPWTSTATTSNRRSVDSVIPLYSAASTNAVSLLLALFAAVVAVFAL